MFSTVRNVHSLGKPTTSINSFVLIVVVMVSLIAEGHAQSSSQLASTASLASSQAVPSAAPQTSAQPTPQPTDSPVSYPDNSCNPEHKDLIDKALRDAMQMNKITTESPTDYMEDPAFWQLFGQRAVDNMTAIRNAFKQVDNGPWSISAICNFDGSAPCNDLAMYGGIAEKRSDAQRRDETQSLSPQLVFCRDFFALPPLDHRLQMGLNHPIHSNARYNLGYFHDNQATTLLRTLFHYLPQSDDLHRPISDLWILVWQNLPTGVTDKWSACYGIACAKVLARVDDDENDWASVNADNYALFALSKYVAPYINDKFPFFPRITGGLYFDTLAVPNDNGTDAPIQVTESFQKPLLYQPNYQASRLQPTKDVFDAENELPPERKADITRATFVQNDPVNSASDKVTAWIQAFIDVRMKEPWNVDATYNRTCFGQDPNQHPYATAFNGNEAVDLVTTFCKDIINNWDDATPIPPTVRDTSHFHNASREYNLTQVTTETHLGFFAVADPATFIQPRSARRFFEGATNEDKISHCALTYKEIIRGCDTTVSTRHGGTLHLNDRLYGVYTTPTNRTSHLPWLTDYTALGALTCTDYNATSYWRIATSVEQEQIEANEVQAPPVAMTDEARLGRMCSCWYEGFPFTADLFCKKGVDRCEEVAGDEGRVAGVWSGFVC